MYGQELKHTKLSNWKARIIFAFFGEIYPGHLIRYFVNRKCLKKYASRRCFDILEIGSNNGAFSFWLSRNSCFSVVGLDNDKKLVIDCIHIAKKINRKKLKFICADASQPFNFEKRFDFIFSSHVLEHINDDCGVLKNAFQNLKDEGFLILQVPYSNPDGICNHEDIIEGHVRDGYSVEDICDKVNSAGFRIQSVGGSIGKIGSFAYQTGMRLMKFQFGVHLGLILVPLIHFLAYCEYILSFMKKNDFPLESGLLVVARRCSDVIGVR